MNKLLRANLKQITLLPLLLGMITIIFTLMTPLQQATAVDTLAENDVFLPITIGMPILETVPVTGPFNQITDITNAGDERLFIGSKEGVIFVVQPTGEKSIFLDIRQQVISAGAEQGLLGVVFHPDYATNGDFFVSYTGKVPGFNDTNLIISRFQVTGNPNVADSDSEEYMVKVGQAFEIHNGGGLAFNPIDGQLYAGIGEDSQFMVAQDPRSMLGKVVIVDVDSPNAGRQLKQFLDAEVAAPTEIVALGLRNPWRFGIDPLYGHLFIGDVGHLSWEEIDVVPIGQRGTNFGWPCMEGPEIMESGGPCKGSEQFSLPIYAYEHSGTACAIIGGEIYRPLNNPAFNGRFIFGDLCSNEIKALSNPTGAWEVELLGTIDTAQGVLTTFGTDNEGSVYAGLYSSAEYAYKLLIP